MWPVRTRRGTRKRCAILFVVVVCATVMVLTRPFVTTPVTQLEDLGIPLPQVAPGSSLSTTTVSSISRNLTTMSSNSSIIVVTTTTPASTPKTTSVSHTVSEIRMTSSSSETDQSVPLSSSPPPAFKPKNASVETSGAPPASVPPSSEKALVPETGGNESSAGVVPSSTLPLPPPPSSSAPPTVYSSIVPEPTPSHIEVGSGRGSLFKKEIDSVTLSKMPTIYVITPTFPRVEQMAEMTRLSQTLMHVPKLHWIVAEDARSKSPELEALLQRTGLAYTYVLGAMPESFRKKKGNKPKGVANRLAGLQWIRDHANDNGVMFFADDDNTYDIRLFEEMRYTKKVSMWPVGLVTQLGVSTPVVRNGKIVDFYDGWIASRKFPVDMAGFAVNVGFLKSRRNATMPFKAGFEEDGFLRSLNVSLTELEPKADNCTKVYVWHTKTVANKPPKKLTDKDKQKFKNTNLFAIPNIV